MNIFFFKLVVLLEMILELKKVPTYLQHENTEKICDSTHSILNFWIDHVKVEFIRILVQRTFAQSFQRFSFPMIVVGPLLVVFLFFKKSELFPGLWLVSFSVGFLVSLGGFSPRRHLNTSLIGWVSTVKLNIRYEKREQEHAKSLRKIKSKQIFFHDEHARNHTRNENTNYFSSSFFSIFDIH